MKRPALASTLFLALLLHAAGGRGEPQSPDSGPLPEVRVDSTADPCASLRSSAATDGSVVDCLEAGTRLRLLEETSEWSHVQLPDGTEGWIDSGYLQAAPPPDSPRRAELKRRLKDLKAQLRSAEQANAQQASRIVQLETELPAAEGREAELRQALTAAEACVATAEQRQAEQAQRIQSLTAELADAERKIAEARLESRLASRPEPPTDRPAESRVKVRAPIAAAPEPPEQPQPPKVSVRMPAAVSQKEAPLPPEVPAEAPIPATEAAINTIQAWAAAWSDQRVDDYLSFYAAGFQPPNGVERSEWEAQRRQRLSGPRFIHVTISGLSAELGDNGTVTATFQQEYESDSFADTVTKVMTLAEEDGAWQMLVEEVTP